jgi:excisionase family DNA binding protein
MNRLEQLESETRALSVCEVAAFLGYSQNYVYELIREGQIEGWFVVKGSYKFCPAEFVKWVRKKLAEGNGQKGEGH